MNNKNTQLDEQEWQQRIGLNQPEDDMNDSGLFDGTQRITFMDRITSLSMAGSVAMILLFGLCVGTVGAWIIDRTTGSDESDAGIQQREIDALPDALKNVPVDPELLQELEDLAGNEPSQTAVDTFDNSINFDLSVNEQAQKGNISRYTQGGVAVRRNSDIGRESALSNLSAWRRYAVAPPALNDLPVIAVVVDDITQPTDPILDDFLKIDAPLTFSLLPTAQGASAFAVQVRNQARELLVDVPMETDEAIDTGANTITTTIDEGELFRRMEWSLQQFDEFVGVNNYKGNVATIDADTMNKMMKSVRENGLIYLDSYVSPRSQAILTGRRLSVPTVQSDFDVNSNQSKRSARETMDTVVQRARTGGSGILTVPATSDALVALQGWLDENNNKNFTIVPLTTVVKFRSFDER